MKRLEEFLNNKIGPLANWMNRNKFFSALSEAFMRITPVTLGAAFLMIIGNFPIPAWINFLADTGLKEHFDAVIGGTINIISIFVTFNFAYVYVRNEKYNPLTAGALAVASFFILMPQKLQVPILETEVTKFPSEEIVTAINPVEAFQSLYTGGTGLLVAILVGFITAKMYCYFNKKNVTIKMSDSVPSNVSESLSPAILSGIIFTLFFTIRVAFSYTPLESVFAFIFGLIQAPLQDVASSPISIILIFTIANLLWFFGIHPNMIYGVVMPILMANGLANMNAFRDGRVLPYLTMSVVSYVCGNGFGGQGSTYGLVVSMFTAKSQRYKQLLKLAGPPSIFNVNEPLIFGAPLMLNPIFFMPMILSPLLMGGAAWGLVELLNFTELNPLISLPFTMPAPILMGLQGGGKYLIIFAVVFIINVVLWYPFFRVADRQAVQEEMSSLN